MMFALQIFYVVLGIGSNAMSLLHWLRNGKTLTPVNPYVGLMTMALYASCAAAQYHGVAGADAALLSMLVVIGYGGVWRHLRAKESTYASAFSRWCAITINSFGVLISAASLAI